MLSLYFYVTKNCIHFVSATAAPPLDISSVCVYGVTFSSRNNFRLSNQRGTHTECVNKYIYNGIA